MSADSVIAEALARIEHKVDLALNLVLAVINRMPGSGVYDLPSMTDQKNLCPVCGKNPQYLLDIFAGIVTRQCGCGTGKVPIDLAALAPPTITRSPHGAHTGTDAGADDTSGSNPRHPNQGRPSGR